MEKLFWVLKVPVGKVERKKKKKLEKSSRIQFFSPSPWLEFWLLADVQPRILGPKHQLIRVIQNNRTRLDCPFFGSPIPTLRW